MSKAYRLCMDDSEKGHEKRVKMKNDWLVEIGGTATYEEYGKLPFSYNYAKETEGYPMLREENANWYFSPIDVQDVGYCTFITEYSIVAPVAEVDFAEAKEVLKAYIPEEVETVDIFTEFYETGKGKPIDGYYSVETDAIWECMNWRGLLDLDTNQLNLKCYLYYSAASFYTWSGGDLYYSIAGGFTTKPLLIVRMSLSFSN